MKVIPSSNRSKIDDSNLELQWVYIIAHHKKWIIYIAPLVILIVEIFYLRKFMMYVESRKGTILQDWLLIQLPSVDLSGPIFLLIYIIVAITCYYIIKVPSLLLKSITTYTLIIVFRYITLYLVPLEPPIGIIPLRDPFLESVIYSNYVLTRDLFFSGHTATLFLCSLILSRSLRYIALVVTVIVAIMLLLQHVHYTVDVLFAPLFTYIAYAIVFQFSRITQRYKEIIRWLCKPSISKIN